jgi:hypothetical protein
LEVEPKRGAALCFYHGSHDLSVLHEGARITSGSKFVLRTDVLYFTNASRSTQ